MKNREFDMSVGWSAGLFCDTAIQLRFVSKWFQSERNKNAQQMHVFHAKSSEVASSVFVVFFRLFCFAFFFVPSERGFFSPEEAKNDD